MGVTYALNKVLRVIPTIVIHEDRRKAIEALKCELMAKGLTIDDTIQERFTELSKDDTSWLIKA